MTEEQAAQICDALARIAVSLENIGKAVEEQRKPLQVRPAAVSSGTAEAVRQKARAAAPRRRPTPA